MRCPLAGARVPGNGGKGTRFREQGVRFSGPPRKDCALEPIFDGLGSMGHESESSRAGPASRHPGNGYLFEGPEMPGCPFTGGVSAWVEVPVGILPADTFWRIMGITRPRRLAWTSRTIRQGTEDRQVGRGPGKARAEWTIFRATV